MKKNKKRVIIIGICVIVALALAFIIFHAARNKVKPILMPADIEKITIYREGTAGTTFSYTNAEKITKLTNYLTSLKLKSTTRTPYGPEIFIGGEWQIRIIGEDICGMKIVGNEFFQHPDGSWWIISQEQAEGFETLLKETVPDEMPDNPMFDEWKRE